MNIGRTLPFCAASEKGTLSNILKSLLNQTIFIDIFANFIPQARTP